MELKRKLILILACSAGLLLRADEASLDAPQHLTLTVDPLQNGTLSWDPIDREDLMGYSIWMRQGKGDFTRLNVPTLVHGEEIKEPMITKSYLVLKGVGKRDLEMAVIAEYEGGRSPKSNSAFSKRARLIPLSYTAEADLSPSASPAGETSSVGTNTAAEEPSPSASPTPDEEILGRAGISPNRRLRSIMAPKGGFHSSIQVEYNYQNFEADGTNSPNQLGFSNYSVQAASGTASSYSQIFYAQTLLVPLRLEYGLLPALEIGLEEDYRSEYDYFTQSGYVISPYTSVSGGSVTTTYQYTYTNSTNSISGQGFMNPLVKVRLQPLPSLPLRLSAQASFATGQRSRLQAWGEYLTGTSQEAGMDDDVSRIQVALDYGNPGIEPGLFYHLDFMPGATESATIQGAGGVVTMTLSHGQEMSAGFGYCFPWWQESIPGSLTAGLQIRSIAAGEWDVNGVNQDPLENNYTDTWFRAFTGTPLQQENQLQLYLAVNQNLYAPEGHFSLNGAIDVGGHLGFTILPDDSWALSAGGGFFY